jgi:signal transduction histidine kinase/CheY-like chemotaxis protein
VWRERVLGSVMWATVGAGALTAFGTSLSAPSFALILAGAVGTVLLAAILRKRFSYPVGVALLLGPLYAYALTVLVRSGFVPNATSVFVMMAIMAALLLGSRWSLALTAVATLTLPIVWLGHHGGALDSLRVPHLYAAVTPDNWHGILRIALSYACISSVCVVAVSYLLDRAEAALSAKSRALDELRRQQVEADRLREHLRQQDEALAKARELETLGRLAGSVAHDFNNALLIIQGNADLVRYDPAHLPLALEEIQAAVQQAASTTRQLRGLGRQTGMPPMRIDLPDAVAQTAKLLRRLLPASIAVRTSEDTSVPIIADEGQIQGILTNLALNARDAMPEGGTLQLRVREASDAESTDVGLDGRFALIEVQDDGTGMSAETQARLFEPYFTTKGDKGTGLGLSSVKSIVESHGGRIAVASQLARGTQLRIFWPLALEGVESPADALRASSPAGATVLVVEDDPRARSVVAGVLRQRGFNVLEASDGADALIAVRRHRGTIDVLCSDCVMPGTPVRPMIEGFREAYPNGRVLLASGYAPEDVAPPLELIDAFLAKPFAPDALAAMIGDLVVAGRTGKTARRPSRGPQ